MNRFFFTFGIGKPYGKFYVEIHADNIEKARDVMLMCHGDRFAFGYDEEKFGDGAKEHDLTRLALITPHSDGYHWAHEEVKKND